MRSHFWRGYLLVILVTLLAVPKNSFAANHYVRASATGTNDGSDWINAWTALPSVLVRGDTYYIAAGTYPSYTFNDPVSGSLFIYIKKATAEDHGTDIGWNDAFGDGQAVFGPISFSTGYWVFDGATGKGKEGASYGFLVARDDCSGLTTSELVSFGTSTVSNVTIRHVEIRNCGPSWDIPQFGIYSNSYSSPSFDITIANNFIHKSTANILIRNWRNSIFEFNHLKSNWSSSLNHGEQMSPGNRCQDITFRYNVLEDSQVGGIGAHIDFNSNWQVYGNIAIGGNVAMGIFGTADSGHNDVIINWSVHNNTFVDIGGSGRGSAFCVGPLTDPETGRSYAYNNLFVNSSHPRLDNSGFHTAAIVHDYNTFVNCVGIIAAETHIEVIGVDPFIDYAGSNFTLRNPTAAGIALPAPFNIDANGKKRGSDGVWDRGAYEYDAVLAGPGSPRNLRIVP